VGPRLICSDARVGHRGSDFRPRLVPFLITDISTKLPPSVRRKLPSVGLSPALHGRATSCGCGLL